MKLKDPFENNKSPFTVFKLILWKIKLSLGHPQKIFNQDFIKSKNPHLKCILFTKFFCMSYFLQLLLLIA